MCFSSDDPLQASGAKVTSCHLPHSNYGNPLPQVVQGSGLNLSPGHAGQGSFYQSFYLIVDIRLSSFSICDQAHGNLVLSYLWFFLHPQLDQAQGPHADNSDNFEAKNIICLRLGIYLFTRTYYMPNFLRKVTAKG